MQTELILLIVCTALLAAAVVMGAVLLAQLGRLRRLTGEGVQIYKDTLEEGLAKTRRELTEEVQSDVKLLGDMIASSQRASFERQDKRIGDLNESLTKSFAMLDERFKGFNLQNEQKLDNIRSTIAKNLASIQEDNGKRLDEMRKTVDEKLQKTLEDRIGQSFKLVSERLEQVYRGLGEMQTLATGVGDLKKVLTNVKTRGILGEIQLGAILEQMLSPEQYDKNVETRQGSGLRVEYAIKMPYDDGTFVYLPIDAKFPTDAYSKLSEAYEAGEPALIDAASSELVARIKRFAKDIKEKYIDPPHTTDFAIMFLPTEGLYAEVVRQGLVEVLQRDYQVSIAGPTTMAALLNSLQMGFRTLAIQKRSSEVWKVLAAVRTEFDKFGSTLAQAQQRITQANDELDKLVGVRTRQIQRKLKDVTVLPGDQTAALLGDPTDEDLG